ncbi:uncharacterized protein LOC141857087 [Brevipalpus obovatus]|uniref:uncharacterized protein LOC141857087 n=1 Tax=Brevipalpus obovatus TaxID=246614 RepID=UPI003D9F0D89
MKYSLFFILLTIGATSGQNVFSGVGNFISCATSLPGAVTKCYGALKERLDLADKAENQIGKDKVDRTAFNCCYFAEFSHCLDVETDKKCSSEIGAYISTLSYDAVKTLNSKCDDYSYTSPTCLFIIYLNIIVIVGLILLALAALSCVVSCLCRR